MDDIKRALCPVEKHAATRGSSLGSLFPKLSPAEREEASENLRQYVAVVLRVLERLEHDPNANAQFEAALTESRAGRTINDKGRQNDFQNNNS